MKIAFWGTGNTALKYIEKIKKFSGQFEMIIFTDGNQEKGDDDSYWEGFRLIPPQLICQNEIDYLCILSTYEWDIRRRIYKEKLFQLSKIISFHDVYMLSDSELDLVQSYQKILYYIHPRQRYHAEKWEIYEFLKRKYSYVLCDCRYWKLNREKKIDFKENIRPVWMLWLQGFDCAPDVVKLCVRSVEKAAGKEDQICLLNQNNLSDYIDLPEFIVEKWKCGIISNTHFSDLVRVRLLNVYGGIWIDSTVYFTCRRMPDYLNEGKLFMFSRWIDWKTCPEPIITANWLIASQAGNDMLMILEALLNEYWRKEEKIADYYLMHIFFTIIAEFLPDQWDQTEKILRDPAQLLSRELDHPYDKRRFEHLKEKADCHKLSYYMLPYEKCGKGSFWAEICEKEGIRDYE